LLEHVLGIDVGLRDRASGAEHALVVAPDKNLEGGAITCEHVGDHVAVGLLGGGEDGGQTRLEIVGGPDVTWRRQPLLGGGSGEPSLHASAGALDDECLTALIDFDIQIQ